MKKIEFDDNVTKIISSEHHNIFSTEGYVGDKTYKLALYGVKENGKRSVYVTVADTEGVLVCFKDIRSDLDEKNAEKALEGLCKRMKALVAPTGEQVETMAVLKSDSEEGILSQPLMVKITGAGIVKEDRQKISICGEMNDWLDELLVMMTTKVKEEKTKEDYQKEYASIMSGAYLPKKNAEDTDYSVTMAVITTILTVLAAIFHNNPLFPVMGLMAGCFATYRCVKNKNTKAVAVCAICVVACLVLVWVSWNAMKTGMNIQPMGEATNK